MFEAGEKDYVPLAEYLFGWRWTDRTRVQISPDHLGRIKPLTAEKAAAAWTYAEAFQGKAYWARFREVDEYHINGRGEPERDDVTQDWLKEHLPSGAERVFVSWTEQQAVETDLEVFIQYWDTFCYPVEDVVIWPASERWVLLFDYKQRFYYAVARGEGTTGSG